MPVSKFAFRFHLISVATIVAAAAILYLPRLSDVPLHLDYDEVFFGEHGRSLSETGRDANGRFLPVYIQAYSDSNYWLQPAAPYFIALTLKVLPLSDAAIRFPTVLMGLATIVLVYFVAVHIFKNARAAVLAAALVALTPAHLIHSRLASDYIYPLPFVMAWLLCLLLFLERNQTWLLFASTTCLGLGFFSYVASVVMMPLYLGVTCLVLLRERASIRSIAIALAGFAWPLLFLVQFLLAHPEVVADFQGRYGLGVAAGQGGSSLNFMGRLTTVVNFSTFAERANLLYDFFSPGFLFVSGGSNIMNSTRESGVFLAPMAVFLLAGLYDAVTHRSRNKTLLVLGFLSAPVAATIVVENYAIDRALALLPFGALLATLGIERMWTAGCHVALKAVYLPAGVGLALLGVAYTIFKLTRQGLVSMPAVGVLLLGVLCLATGWQAEKTRRWRPVVVALLLLSLVQFQYFYRDYFGDYPARSAAWFGNNIRGGIERMLVLDGERRAPRLLLSAGITHVDAYWRLYTDMLGRRDMRPRAELFKVGTEDLSTVPPDSLLLCLPVEAERHGLASRPDLTQAASATDPNEYYSLLGPGEHVTFLIYRKLAGPGPAPAN